MNIHDEEWKSKIEVSRTRPGSIIVLVKVNNREETFSFTKLWKRYRSASFSPPQKKGDARFIDTNAKLWWGVITLEYIIHSERWRTILWWEKTSHWEFSKYRWYSHKEVAMTKINDERKKGMPIKKWRANRVTRRLVPNFWKTKLRTLLPSKEQTKITVPAV